ncbi:MAG: Crp/Fnr family transcriptional regulator [Gammaproteobacteria bacterium]|nr:Crp/Fnr family transcriptional regulator [Gammaproteobacteria bacterium]
MDDITITATGKGNKIEPLLRQNPLFSRLTRPQLEEMCQYSRTIELQEGESLFHHGDMVVNFYFVIEGLIKLFRQSADGHEKIFELEGAGRTFAEALMFHELNHYPVSATAMRKSTVLAINSRKFQKILVRSPDTCLLIMGDLSKRLHELIGDIESLSLLTGRNRLATYFLDKAMHEGQEFDLDIPKSAIASILSLQPETFSRLLKELTSKHIITARDCHIEVLDMQRLREQAGIV